MSGDAGRWRLVGLAALATAWLLASLVWDPIVVDVGGRLPAGLVRALLVSGAALAAGAGLGLVGPWRPRRPLRAATLHRAGLLLAAAAAATMALGLLAPPLARFAPLANVPGAAALVLAVGQRAGAGPERRGWALLLVVGLALGVRLLLFLGHPAPFWEPDTPGYVHGAHAWWSGGGFDQDVTRGPGLGALYAAATGAGGLLAFRLAQAALGLGAAAAVGLTLARRGAPDLGVAAAAVLLLDPLGLYFEATVMAETLLGAVLLALALCLLRGVGPPEGRPAWLLAAGLAGGLAMLVKPVALAALPAAGLVALACPRPARRRALCAAAFALGAALPIVGWSARNQAVHGFFGVTLYGGLSLFGVAGHLVPLDTPAHAPEKALIRAHLEAYRARGDLDDIDWLMHDAAGPMPLLAHLEPRARDRLLSELALEGIRAAPHRFAWATLVRARFYLRPCYRPWHPPPLEEVVAQHPPPGLSYRPAAAVHALHDPPRRLEDALGGPAREAAWQGASRAVAVIHAGLYPLLMTIHLLALAAALLRRRREVVIPALLAWAVIGLTVIGNVARPRYLLPLMPLLVLAAGSALAPPAGGAGRD